MRCLAAGMDGFLAKPIHAEDLWRKLDLLVAARTERGPVPGP